MRDPEKEVLASKKEEREQVAKQHAVSTEKDPIVEALDRPGLLNSRKEIKLRALVDIALLEEDKRTLEKWAQATDGESGPSTLSRIYLKVLETLWDRSQPTQSLVDDECADQACAQMMKWNPQGTRLRDDGIIAGKKKHSLKTSERVLNAIAKNRSRGRTVPTWMTALARATHSRLLRSDNGDRAVRIREKLLQQMQTRECIALNERIVRVGRSVAALLGDQASGPYKKLGEQCRNAIATEQNDRRHPRMPIRYAQKCLDKNNLDRATGSDTTVTTEVRELLENVCASARR